MAGPTGVSILCMRGRRVVENSTMPKSGGGEAADVAVLNTLGARSHTNMITIVDYGMGNLRSVHKAFERVGAQARISVDGDEIRKADKLVLPGVGAFRDAMQHLREQHLVEPILEFIQSGRPFLGICLGLQMLFTTSEEDGEHEGLNVFPGKVVRFQLPPNLKVPHMGWNQLLIRRRPPVLIDVPEQANVYFVHSYYVVPEDGSITATQTEYGLTFTSMIWKDNIVASQFHPEKSQQVGLTMLKNFSTW
jgi:glutamine amidotransferase